MNDPYGFDWMALLPLIAVASERGDFDHAVQQVRALFGENQHPLPETLTVVANEAIRASGNKAADAVREKIKTLIQTSREIGYL